MKHTERITCFHLKLFQLVKGSCVVGHLSTIHCLKQVSVFIQDAKEHKDQYAIGIIW